MLRRYHSTQLAEAGMEEGKIDMLQGRKPRSVLYQSYLKIKSRVLKDEYIECLPYLVIEDINKYKTELEVSQEKNSQLESENVELKKQNDETRRRIDNLEKIVLGNLSDDEKRELHNVL